MAEVIIFIILLLVCIIGLLQSTAPPHIDLDKLRRSNTAKIAKLLKVFHSCETQVHLEHAERYLVIFANDQQYSFLNSDLYTSRNDPDRPMVDFINTTINTVRNRSWK